MEGKFFHSFCAGNFECDDQMDPDFLSKTCFERLCNEIGGHLPRDLTAYEWFFLNVSIFRVYKKKNIISKINFSNIQMSKFSLLKQLGAVQHTI